MARCMLKEYQRLTGGKTIVSQAMPGIMCRVTALFSRQLVLDLNQLGV